MPSAAIGKYANNDHFANSQRVLFMLVDSSGKAPRIF
jgi:hypothetical protein